MTEEELQALWLTQPVRCVGNFDPPCGWSGVGAEVTEYEEGGELPLCPKCDGGVVENVLAPPTARDAEGETR